MHNLPSWTRDGQGFWVTLSEYTATSGLHYAQQSPWRKHCQMVMVASEAYSRVLFS